MNEQIDEKFDCNGDKESYNWLERNELSSSFHILLSLLLSYFQGEVFVGSLVASLVGMVHQFIEVAFLKESPCKALLIF